MRKIFNKKLIYILISAAIVILLLASAVLYNQKSMAKWKPDESVVGVWSGNTKAYIAISNNKEESRAVEYIDIEIIVNEDGTVMGYVGDAELYECNIELNRTAFERFINVKTDKIIKGQLQGTITDQDIVDLRDITIPLNIAGEELSGSIFTIYRIKYPYPFVSKLRLKKE